jgi:hypothetical protein
MNKGKDSEETISKRLIIQDEGEVPRLWLEGGSR